MNKKSSLSPTQRTLKDLRARGAICAITEHWNQWARRRQDLFGIFDLLCIDPVRGIIGIQCCAGASHSARRKKILANPIAPEWVKWAKIELWSWSKRKVVRGKKAGHWVARVEEITREDFKR